MGRSFSRHIRLYYLSVYHEYWTYLVVEHTTSYNNNTTTSRIFCSAVSSPVDSNHSNQSKQMDHGNHGNHGNHSKHETVQDKLSPVSSNTSGDSKHDNHEDLPKTLKARIYDVLENPETSKVSQPPSTLSTLFRAPLFRTRAPLYFSTAHLSTAHLSTSLPCPLYSLPHPRPWPISDNAFILSSVMCCYFVNVPLLNTDELLNTLSTFTNSLISFSLIPQYDLIKTLCGTIQPCGKGCQLICPHFMALSLQCLPELFLPTILP